jgi:glycosyltransferase involved in cell wall biosynthesis
MNKLVSIVIPAHNEEDNIIEIISRIERVFTNLSYNYELIFVDDGSHDNTLVKLQEQAHIKSNIFYISFSKNFGHQLALIAGLNHAKGDCVISLDADLQHPPELFVQMLQKWEDGFDVVYTKRKIDYSLPLKKRKSSEYFYKFLNSLSDVEIEQGAADFRLLDRKALDALNQFKESEPFIRGMVKMIGFKQYALEYTPNKRFAGTSKYSLSKMRKLAVHGVTSLSVKPLHTAVYLGFFFSVASILYVPYVCYSFYTNHEVSGWASLIMTVVFFGGLQLIILGILGLYIGKMFMVTKNRPNYIIQSTNL